MPGEKGTRSFLNVQCTMQWVFGRAHIPYFTSHHIQTRRQMDKKTKIERRKERGMDKIESCMYTMFMFKLHETSLSRSVRTILGFLLDLLDNFLYVCAFESVLLIYQRCMCAQTNTNAQLVYMFAFHPSSIHPLSQYFQRFFRIPAHAYCMYFLQYTLKASDSYVCV